MGATPRLDAAMSFSVQFGIRGLICWELLIKERQLSHTLSSSKGQILLNLAQAPGRAGNRPVGAAKNRLDMTVKRVTLHT